MFVGFEALPDDVEVSIVQPAFEQGTALDALDHLPLIRTGEMQHSQHVDVFAHHFNLMWIARNAIEHQKVLFGMECSLDDGALHIFLPKCDGEFVGH